MSVCAVVVTYNRRALLEECLTALEAQTRPVDRVLVVDNASSDGTGEFVRQAFPAVELLSLPVNEGGAGGFHLGMARAYEQGFDWLWVMDDDTIPTPTALEQLLAAPQRLAPELRPLIMMSKILTPAGEFHPFNRPWPDQRHVPEAIEAAEVGLYAMRYGSFVSMLVHREAVGRYGLPRRGFFIWFDDVEFSARVLRREHGYVVPASVVHHKSPVKASAEAGDRFYYSVRNMLWMLRSGAFDESDRLVELRLWFSFVRSARYFLALNRFRPAAVRAVARGLVDGLRPPPD